MNDKKNIFKKYVIVIVALVFAVMMTTFSSSVFAGTKTIIAEGYYNMGDSEALNIAYDKARLEAKRVAVEEAGTYIESYSQVNNCQLTQDEVRVIASGVLSTRDLDKKAIPNGDGLKTWVKIEATVNSDDVEAMRSKLQDRRVVEDYKKLQTDYDQTRRENEALKEQLHNAQTRQEQQESKERLANNEKRYMAILYVDKGLMNFLRGDIANAAMMLSKAIEFDIHYTATFSLTKMVLGFDFFIKAKLF